MFIANRFHPTSIMLILLVAVLLPFSTYAAPKSYQIDLPTRTLTPDDDAGAWLSQRSNDSAQSVLLQFRDHPDAAAKRALGLAGIQLQEYIGGGAWVAYVPAYVNSSVFTGMDLRWAGPMVDADKIDARVEANQVPQWADTPDGILYLVAMMKNVPESEAEVLLRDAGAVPGDYIVALHTWHVLGNEDLPTNLASDPRVHYIGFISPQMGELNAGLRATMNVDPLQNPPYNLSGIGETVCVYDGGLVYPHVDFGNRLTAGEGGTQAAHATHVAGTVGGAGGDLYRGMAPEVTLISYYYEQCIPYCLYDSPQDIYENYEGAYLSGAYLFTNSIGANVGPNGYDCNWLGDYESVSALVDSLTRGPFGEPLIITWAAGNERGAGCPGSYETMSVPSGAKNTIVVGATTDNDGMTSFSSWGPTDDGRIKPDVTAPGSNVTSCNAGGGYTTMSGTSMATPGVAGVNALLLQAWHQSVNSDENPLPETVKALLCNGAEDLGTGGPDYAYGFGRVDAQASVDMIYSFGFHEGVMEDDGLETVTFEVPVGLNELRITLSWSDVPGGYLPEFALVNDLDLGLRDPTNFEYQPFVMDPANPSSPATNGVNTIDNVEQIIVPNPMPGEWTLGVQGTDVPVGPQTFGVAANVPLVAGLTSISGAVTDAITGETLDGVTIQMTSQTGDLQLGADDEGQFLFYTLMDGDARLTFTRTGYIAQSAWAIDDGDGSVVLFVEMYPAESASVTGSVYSEFGVAIPGAVVIIQELPSITATTDEDGLFDLFDVPTGELLTVFCDYSGLTDEELVFLEPGETAIAELVVTTGGGDGLIGPDEGGYIAVQSGDDHPMAPVYSWVAIDPLEDGPGVRVPMPAEETPVVINLPFSFPYYDSVYTDITVNENGFFSFGDRSYLDPGEAADYSNSPLPDVDGPPATIAPFWEDMRAEETNLSYYDDPAEGQFIVEWYDTRQWPEDGERSSFQVIFYDPEVYPEHGDWGHILFQYLDVNDLGNATVGIEDETETIGLTILYFDGDGNGGYHPNASTIVDESAIYFFRPTAGITGELVLDPPNPEAIVTMTVGEMSFEIGEGEFTFMSMIPGFSVFSYETDGYEYDSFAEDLMEGNVTDLGTITLTRLDTPVNVFYEELDGSFDNGASVYWEAPTFEEIDEFLGMYRVYKDGLMIGQTEELTYADEEPYVGADYWVTAMYAGGESDSSGHAEYLLDVADGLNLIPTEFNVAPPWPNPFNPSTAIKVSLPQQANLNVAVFDVLGREVARLASNDPRQAGNHRLVWDAAGHASGVYFVRVSAGPNSAVKKVMLLK